jgi:hypothetical protein
MTKATLFLMVLLNMFFCLSEAQGQQAFKAYFSKDTLRFNSSSTKTIEAPIEIKVINSQALTGGRVAITIINSRSNVKLNEIKVPISNEFKIGAAADTVKEKYNVSVPRHSKDDRVLVLALEAYDSKGKRIPLSDKDSALVVYVKPFAEDSLTRDEDFEFWLFTGTNFDPFEGAKPQEFFFRANTMFKISSRFYGQIGIYKNRYFNADSATIIPIFLANSPARIVNGIDTSYSYLQGSYQRSTSQKIDPVGLQIDGMFKLGDLKKKGISSFFATAGLDISTKSIRLENKFTNFDTATVLFSRPDSRGRTLAPPTRDQKVHFQVPTYNFNVGLLWVLNKDDVNIKAQLTGGFSSFQGAKIFIPRGTNEPTVSYDSLKAKPYIQLRMFATAINPGLSFGFETFVRKELFPQFNFTLSKVFDLRNFLKVLTPVIPLKTKAE